MLLITEPWLSNLFEIFEITSVIMPYYASTHQAFLLLSQLWFGSRFNLDEHYQEFVDKMKNYWMWLQIDSADMFKNLTVPNDLFEIKLKTINSKDVVLFVAFIQWINKLKGRYFNKHYMHSTLKFQDPVYADFSWIEQLFPCIEIMKSIKVEYLRDSNKSNKLWSQQTTLDTISIFIS